MRLFIVFAIAASSVAFVPVLVKPTLAIEGEAAAVACEKRPKNCIVDYGEKGDLIILVDNGPDGSAVISCPPKASCQITGKPNPKGGGGRTIVRGNPVSVISGPPGKTGAEGGKTDPVATSGKTEPVATAGKTEPVTTNGKTDTATVAGKTDPKPPVSRPVVRDHRGKDNDTQYVRNGLKPTGARSDPGWGNYGKGKGDGPEVRDHRN